MTTVIVFLILVRMEPLERTNLGLLLLSSHFIMFLRGEVICDIKTLKDHLSKHLSETLSKMHKSGAKFGGHSNKS